MKKISIFFSIFLIQALAYSQTILTQQETSSREVLDPQAIVLAPGFHAKSEVVNPFIAKVGGAVINPNNPNGSTAQNPNVTPGDDPNSVSNFHDTQGNIDVNGGGQLQYTLPIALPPGIKSVAPQMNLVYTSGSGNGIAGYGWNISGITSISRMGRTIEKDGEIRGVQLDYSDYYSFNGQRLILKSGSYGRDGAEYTTEKFSNVKIRSIGAISGQTWQGPEYWEVTFEDGSQAWYGALSTGSSNARTPIEYNIVKWKDAQGNYISYNYTQSYNVAAVSTIQWGGNETLGKAHFNEIVFNYKNTNIREQSYLKSISFIQSKILDYIQVKTNGEQFKKYELTHSTNKSNYFIIQQIVERNSFNQASNPITFEYPTDAVQTEFLYENKDMSKAHKLYADFNKDGIVDYIEYNNKNIYYKKSAYIDSQPLQLYFDNTRFSESDFKKAITITFKDINNTVKTLTGVLIPVKIINSITGKKDYELQVYSVDTNNQSLKYEYSKIIPFNLYHIIDSVDYDTGDNRCSRAETNLQNIKNFDYNADGLDELIFSFSRNIICRPKPVGGNPHDPQEPQEKNRYYLSKAFVNFTSENFNNKDFFIYNADNDFAVENFWDFNGDGITDILKFGNTNNIASIYNIIKKDTGYFELKKIDSFNQPIDGVYSKSLYGDFNGDGKTDLLVPQGDKTSNWFLYLSNGNNFNKFIKNNFIYFSSGQENSDEGRHNTTFESGCNYGTYTYHQYSVEDLNNDGKSEIIVKKLILRNHEWSAHYDKEYTELFLNVYSNENGSQGDGNVNFSNIFSKYYNFQDKVIPFSMITLNRDNRQLVIVGQPDDCKHNNCDYNYIYHFEFPNLQKYSRISSITQGGLTTQIDYKELDPSINPGLYAPVKQEQYPYMELDKVSQSYVVSQLRQPSSNNEIRKQDFKYRGFLTHLQGKGMVGFRQTARSSWYTDTHINTKIWSGAEIDPMKEGVPIKEWSVKTNNDDALIFPADLSENNNQLLSFKSTEYKIDKLLNGSIVSNFTDNDKPNIVTAIVPKKTRSKDFKKSIISESEIEYDGGSTGSANIYYLPTKTTTSINGGYGITSTEISYTHNSGGVGKDYFIGRPNKKTEKVTAYSDSKGSTEYYTYTNNLLSNLIKYASVIVKPNTLALGIGETYQYDGWGNLIEKRTEKVGGFVGSGSTPPIIFTEKAEYEDKGRFVIKKTDNLDLETTISYNNWGQILAQTDPFGIILTNTYDAWGKLLTSGTSLSGVTKYIYKKEGNGDAVVMQYTPDGGEKISWTNKLGQTYKTTTRGFKQGSYVSKYVEYDGLGRKTKESEPYYNDEAPKWNTIAYDDNNFPESKATATSFTGKIMETSVSGRTTVVKENNGNLRTTTKTTDELGNVVASTDKGGTINFTYNASGQQLSATYGTNKVTTKYDNWGRKVEFHDPSNGVYKYKYDIFGNLLKETSPKGYKAYTYNSKAQLINQKEVSDDGVSTNKNINYNYNSKGLITDKIGTANGKTYSSNISYDNFGRVLASSENSNGKYFMRKNITYDDKMRVISYEKSLYSGGQYTKVNIENVYSTWGGDLYQVKDKNQNKVLWELQNTEADGRVKNALLGGTKIENIYAADNFLINTSHNNISNNATVLQMSYSFNAIKNELNSRSRGGNFNISEVFQYDENNRLYNWTDPVTGAFTHNSLRNTYDEKGRILKNDQVGEFKFEDNNKIYQPTGITLNTEGQQNYTNNLIQKINYNENNDPIFIDGVKGDVGFTYGLTNMRQMATYGGNFDKAGEGKLTKYYSEDGSYEVIRNNQTGQEKHILYIGGTPYESNIVYLKDFVESSGSYKFLHKDYLGSILAISDEAGNTVEQRHFDAWGNFTHLKVGVNTMIVGVDQVTNYLVNNNLLVDRGYTSHEHFMEVGIIHMNGRLYDPLLRRFLNADENIQDMFNTQNYNKYGYVMNNPLMYNDPSGEIFFFAALVPILGKVFAGVIAGIIGGIAVGGGMYLAQAAITGSFSWSGFGKSIMMGAITGAVSGGLGQVFSASGFWAIVGNGALAGAGSGSITALIDGTNFLRGLIKGGVFGGAIAGISYTIAYLTQKDIVRGVSASDSSSELSYDPNISNEEMNSNLSNAEKKLFTTNERYGTGEHKLGKMADNGYLDMGEKAGAGSSKFLAYADSKYNYFTGRYNVYYSARIAQNPFFLDYAMMHETGHVYSQFLNLGKGLQKNLDLKLNNWEDTIEHLALGFLEHDAANIRNVIYKSSSYFIDFDILKSVLPTLSKKELNIFNDIYIKLQPIFTKPIK